jgi:hypothetical protein
MIGNHGRNIILHQIVMVKCGLHCFTQIYINYHPNSHQFPAMSAEVHHGGGKCRLQFELILALRETMF